MEDQVDEGVDDAAHDALPWAWDDEHPQHRQRGQCREQRADTREHYPKSLHPGSLSCGLSGVVTQLQDRVHDGFHRA